ncbi:MAG: hypothetical protein IIB00_07355 [candidate division Zixibacteria bacterium]|nr:hypothetical protein [candidate division Zixibacteria bacterium]
MAKFLKKRGLEVSNKGGHKVKPSFSIVKRFLSHRILILGIAVFGIVLVKAALAQNNNLNKNIASGIYFSDIKPGELKVQGFELNKGAIFDIEAVGAKYRHSDALQAYAWIIDADSRELIWEMEERDTDRYHRSKKLCQVVDELDLDPGRYEVYYYVANTSRRKGSSVTIDFDELEKWFDGKDFDFDRDDFDDNLDDFFEELEKFLEELGEELEDLGDNFTFTVNGLNGNFHLSRKDQKELRFEMSNPHSKLVMFKPNKDRKGLALVDFTEVGDSRQFSQGFTLSRETKLRVRALGEYSQSGNIFVDYAWIIDANTRERVWEMDKWSTDYAGGGRKNRYAYEKVKLPAGDYVAYYMSDDSHSFERWNTAPPYDPFNYGLLITVDDIVTRKSIREFSDEIRNPVVFAIDRVGNNEFASQGFTLKKDCKLRIVCYGEYSSREFHDFGWIEDLDDNDEVFILEEDNSFHAGGAAKNRMFDGVITLPAGDYMAHYVSDGSHAYNNWNSSKPFDPQKWGITVYGAGKNFDKNSINLFDNLPQNSSVLVNLTRLGDDEDISQRFTLKERSRVTILALGEGMGRTMYDYGWIESLDDDDVVWEMTYRRTRHAGGADKNRIARSTITLDAGRYEAFFVTDGSHSFRDFNSTKPHKPHLWGMTISLAK